MAHKRRRLPDFHLATDPSGQYASKHRRTLFCPHCDCDISKTAYYEHRALYDQMTQAWRKENEYIDATPDFAPTSVVAAPVQQSTSESSTAACMDFTPESYARDADEDNAEPESEPIDTDYGSTAFHDQGMEVWDQDLDEENATEYVHVEPMPYSHQRLVKWYTVVMLTFQCLFSLSDSALKYILSFIAKFLGVLAHSFSSDPMKAFAAAIPSTIVRARSLLKCKDDLFRIYASCPKCDARYDPQKCIKTHFNGTKESKVCTYVAFPCHPHQSFRAECNAVIMKAIKTPSGNAFYYPIRSYCYLPIINALSSILQRIEKDLYHWQSDRQNSRMFDIYDGNMWKKFQVWMNENPNNICLSFTLNVDWFRPFDHLQESIGAMYLSINNLPRHQRFKQNNILLVGLIPGPKEPERINPYLEPLVEELKELVIGVNIHGQTVQAVLSCVANDVPAARKICGFAGHSARLACTKCKKIFPTEIFGEKPDFSGYDYANWPPRCDDEVKRVGLQYLQARTKQERKQIIREYGCRYSLLQELPCFSVVSNTIIDPMHNLYLGTAKHLYETWTQKKLVSDKHFASLQGLVDNTAVPRDIGRIPQKIKSGFSGFTADQWRLWTLIFSVVCLHGVLPSADLECWRQFVIACTLFSCKAITVETVNLAHEYVVRFCQLSTIPYGKSFCTLNMHLHCHLREFLLDYGPVQSFWLFSFERYNGILGELPNNHRSITIQLMRKFTQFMNVASIHEDLPEDLKDTFIPFLHYGKLCGSLQQSCDPTTATMDMIPHISGPIAEHSWDKATEKLCPPIKERVLTSHELQTLTQFYELIYPNQLVAMDINRIVVYSHRASCGNLRFSSRHVANSSAVMAFWGIPDPKLLYGDIDCIIQSKVKLTISGVVRERQHILAIVNWFTQHPLTNLIGFPWTICYNEHEPLQPSSFIPLLRIPSRCAKLMYVIDPSVNQEHANETVIAVAPVDFICADFLFKYMIQR